MSERFTRAAARNIFYGGSAIFLIAFVALTAQSHHYILTTSTDAANLSESVARGKRVWERNACIDCHTLHGEGAYFAPELGNVWARYGGEQDKEAARAARPQRSRRFPGMGEPQQPARLAAQQSRLRDRP